ncbi:MAG: GNAT family N-acetyltransferase, partial [Candidatus Micrarchaeaceae archaeon]
ELGWVFITPDARRQGQSFWLAKDLLTVAGKRGVFATSRTDNVAMHKTLAKLSFSPVGHPYLSPRGGYELQLFIRVV